MEIESALVAHPIVAEAAVVGKPDETTGEAICAFVVLKQARPTGEEAKKLAAELRNWVGKEIAPARSCAACCACWPRARRSPRTSPRWKTRPFWNS
jgi:acyl-coenzyme A synthetase/AMP-(fatty) acid ligase